MLRKPLDNLNFGEFVFQEKTQSGNAAYYLTIREAVSLLNRQHDGAPFHYWEAPCLSDETNPLLCVTDDRCPGLVFLTKFDVTRGAGAMFPGNDSVLTSLMADKEYALAIDANHPRTHVALAGGDGQYDAVGIRAALQTWKGPFVVKNAVGGSCGAGVYFASDVDAVIRIIRSHCDGRYEKLIVSQYLAGVEDTFYVVAGECVGVRRKRPPSLSRDPQKPVSGQPPTLRDQIVDYFGSIGRPDCTSPILMGLEGAFLTHRMSQYGLTLDSRNVRAALPLDLHFVPGSRFGGSSAEIQLDDAEADNLVEAKRVMRSIETLGGAFFYGIDIKGGYLLDVNDVSLSLQMEPAYVSLWASVLQLYFETREVANGQFFGHYRKLSQLIVELSAAR